MINYLKKLWEFVSTSSFETRKMFFVILMIPFVLLGFWSAGWFFSYFIGKVSLDDLNALQSELSNKFKGDDLVEVQDSFLKAKEAQDKMSGLLQEIEKYENATSATSSIESLEKLQQEFGIEINQTSSSSTFVTTTSEMPIEEIKLQ